MVNAIRRTPFFIVSSFFFGALLQGAAAKDIFGMITVRSTACVVVKKDKEAVLDLFRCITAKEFTSEETIPELLAQITEVTGLAIDVEDMLISLDIHDAPRATVLLQVPEGWHNGNDRCSQLKDSRGKQAKICVMWPYRWFMRAYEGDTVRVPLWGGEFFAYLTIAQRPKEHPHRFNEAIALNVGFALAQMQIDEDKELCDLKNKIRLWYTALSAIPHDALGEDKAQAICIGKEITKLNRIKRAKEYSYACQAVKQHYDIS